MIQSSDSPVSYTVLTMYFFLWIHQTGRWGQPFSSGFLLPQVDCALVTKRMLEELTIIFVIEE